jgi:hypothetical protein
MEAAILALRSPLDKGQVKSQVLYVELNRNLIRPPIRRLSQQNLLEAKIDITSDIEVKINHYTINIKT